MSFSAGSSSSSNGQFGARPKIARPDGTEPSSSGRPSQPALGNSKQEWNANWNAVLSAQANGKMVHGIKTIRSNGQPPSYIQPRSAAHPSPAGWVASAPSISRGVSDPSLASKAALQRLEPVIGGRSNLLLNAANNKENRPEKSDELFHSHHYQARRQRERAATSRSSSAADLSRSSSTINQQHHQVTKDSGGLSNILARWFRRSNNTSHHGQSSRHQANSSVVSYAENRAHSVENSPVVIRRGAPVMVRMGSNASGMTDIHNSDSLSTHSFAFIRPMSDDSINAIRPEQMTLRRKYGLLDAESICQLDAIEGDAIRAMRTRWESQMKQAESSRVVVANGSVSSASSASIGGIRPSQSSTTASRKKRPAPPPPTPPPQTAANAIGHHRNSSRSSVTSSGFAHVPGKRRAPSPPVQPQREENVQQPDTALNILPPSPEMEVEDDVFQPAGSPAPYRQTNQTNNATLPHPATNGNSAMPAKPIFRPTSFRLLRDSETPPRTEKWTNDLNSNLDQERTIKAFRYDESKIENHQQLAARDCPHNDILKLEDGLLRPVDPLLHHPVASKSTETLASGTLDNRMTLPMKPWYKRGHHHSPHPHKDSNRSKWKDAALLTPPPLIHVDDTSWMSPSLQMDLRRNHSLSSPPVSPESTLTVSTVSPGGSTRSGASSNSSGASKRKSLLVNISQLDREAAEIIQRERVRESQRKRIEDDKFYSHLSVDSLAIEGAPSRLLEPVPDEETNGETAINGEDPPKCTRQLINMFNSFNSYPSMEIRPDATALYQSKNPKSINSFRELGSASTAAGDATAVQQSNSANNKTADPSPALEPVTAGISVDASLPHRDKLAHGLVSAPATADTAATLDSQPAATLGSSNTISRLRVNRETIETAQPPIPISSSIFNPKLQVVSPVQRPSGGRVEYTGGARPKYSSSTFLKESVGPLVNRSTADKSSAITSSSNKTSPASGWACHVCTLLNSDARLWCEACTALKPRQLGQSRSPTSPTPADKKLLPDKIVHEKTLPINNSLTNPVSVTSPEVTVNGDNLNHPSSPEALRQARLAFFLNGRERADDVVKPVVQQQLESQSVMGDLNNNKRHSQIGVKVSSGCQTQTRMLPSLQKSRPLSMNTDNAVQISAKKSDSRSSPPIATGQAKIEKPPTSNLNLPRLQLKAVTPTNFTVVSPSRTQLSQYLQQRDQQLAKDSRPSEEPSIADTTAAKIETKKESSVERDEKRVQVLLLRLEEAITAGQFDKASVLAKELAAIKRPATKNIDSPSTVPPVESTGTADGSNGKPVAAPRSVVPIATTKLNANSAGTMTVAGPTPLPAKRRSISDASPRSRSVQPAMATIHGVSPPVLVNETKEVKTKAIEPVPEPELIKEEHQTVNDSSSSSLENVPNEEPKQTDAGREQKVEKSAQISVVVRPKKTKVSSGQQTTLTFQDRKSSADEKRQSQLKNCDNECITVDDTFNVEVFIEDRSTHSGPFPIAVRPITTLIQLKEQMEKERGIRIQCQRWILGRRLADRDEMSLKDYDISPSNSSLFLYILREPPPTQSAPPDPPVPTVQPASLATDGHQQQGATDLNNYSRKYYNAEEDRYSTCDEESTDDESAVIQPQKLVHESRTDELPVSTPQSQPTVTPNGDWTCPQCMSVYPMTNPRCEPCGNQRRPEEAVHVADSQTAVDYKKLIDLDHSEVVANFADFDCSVCLMNVPSGVGITLRECLHNFCRDCLAHVIEFSDDAAIVCPYRDDNYACDAALQEREIKALVAPNVYEKHLERSMRLAEKAMKNTFHCQTADCAGWAIIEDNVNVFKCPVCRQSNCLTCQAIHEGANCKEYQDRVNKSAETDEDAKRTKEMIDALVASGEALSCPQCQVVLMKRWGCDWVRCSVCRTEICWVTKQARWGPKGKGDISGGCRCGVNGVKCHIQCNYCH